MTRKILVALLALACAGSLAAKTIELDQGVRVRVPRAADPVQTVTPGPPLLAGFDLAIDLTHNTGRQGMVTTAYTTIQGDIMAQGANLTFVNTGPLSYALLRQYDAWWIEEDWGAVYTSVERKALKRYVWRGGCLFLNGDEHDDGLLALFRLPYLPIRGASGYSTDITPHRLTLPMALSPFPGPVLGAYIPAPVQCLDPVPPAFEVVGDRLGDSMVGVYPLGLGLVVVFSDELSWNGTILNADNRTLANRVFEVCSIWRAVRSNK